MAHSGSGLVRLTSMRLACFIGAAFSSALALLLGGGTSFASRLRSSLLLIISISSLMACSVFGIVPWPSGGAEAAVPVGERLRKVRVGLIRILVLARY